MKTKKIPLRMCLGCKEMKPKKEMLRIVHTPQGTIVADITGKVNGRGAYICYSGECLQACIKSKAINRAFETNVESSVYDEIQKVIDNAK